MKVISALLHESMHIPNLGTITVSLPGPKFPGAAMTLIDSAVLFQVKGKSILIPLSNFRYVELQSEEPKASKK